MTFPTKADSMTEKETLGEKIQRYQQLKVSVQALRSQVRSNPSPKPRPCSRSEPPACPSLRPSTTQGVQIRRDWDGSIKCSDKGSTVAGIACLIEEPAALQVIRIQAQMEHEKEVQALQEKLKRKVKKMEALKLENVKQKKKLEARLQFFDGRCRSLEAQFSEQTERLTKEIGARQEVFDDICRRDEEEHQRVLQTLRVTYEARISSLTKEHEGHYNKTQSKLMREVSTNEAWRDQAGRLEGELASVSAKMEEARAYHQQKEEEWKLKLQCFDRMHQERIANLNKELAERKADWEKERKEHEETHAMAVVAYKQQKMHDIDCLAERVKAALETKDMAILQLKAELKKLQNNLSQTTQLFQEQACHLLQMPF